MAHNIIKQVTGLSNDYLISCNLLEISFSRQCTLIHVHCTCTILNVWATKQFHATLTLPIHMYVTLTLPIHMYVTLTLPIHMYVTLTLPIHMYVYMQGNTQIYQLRGTVEEGIMKLS